jgi:hypothetical protein
VASESLHVLVDRRGIPKAPGHGAVVKEENLRHASPAG